jgi:hypothetical protein
MHLIWNYNVNQDLPDNGFAIRVNKQRQTKITIKKDETKYRLFEF